MKKTYTRPEIQVSKFDVETVVTTGTSVAALTASLYVGDDAKQVVQVVDYTTIFQK